MRIFFTFLFLILGFTPVFSVENMDVWNPYLEKIENKIKTSWYDVSAQKRHDRECATTLLFSVKSDGKIGSSRILASDCPNEMQEMAELALKKAAPFAPFPQKVASVGEININYNFRYRLLPENKQILSQTSKDYQKPSSNENKLPIRSVADDIVNSADNSQELSDTSSVQAAKINFLDKEFLNIKLKYIFLLAFALVFVATVLGILIFLRKRK